LQGFEKYYQAFEKNIISSETNIQVKFTGKLMRKSHIMSEPQVSPFFTKNLNIKSAL